MWKLKKGYIKKKGEKKDCDLTNSIIGIIHAFVNQTLYNLHATLAFFTSILHFFAQSSQPSPAFVSFKMFVVLLLILWSFAAKSLARGITSAEGAACLNVANNFTNFPFDCPQPDLSYTCRCVDKSFLGTVINCIETYAQDSQALAQAYSYLLDTCSSQGHQKYRMVHVASIYDNATEYLKPMDSIETSSVLRNPVTISQKAFTVSYDSVVNLMKQRNDSTYMGWALYGYWAIIFLVAAVINIAHWCCPYASERIEQTKFVNWLRRSLICPQLVRPSQLTRLKLFSKNDNKKTENTHNLGILESVYRLPVRVHALIIFVYFCLVAILCCVDYKIVSPNTIFRCPKGQKFVDYADRTGIIGTIQLPLVFLFAARNNPLTKITGFSYRTFQTFHKWVSRIAFILLLLHCVFYLSYVRARGDYIARWGLLKWRMANTAFSALCITMVWGSLRRRYYEWFKASHKILLIIFTVGAWYHCLTLGWIEYLAVSFSIWAADYIFRIAKIASTGGLLKARCKVIYRMEEQLESGKKILKKVPHSIRMEVNHSGWWKPFPGVYCWVYFMRWNMAWQAHPFTVVSTTSQQNFNQLVFIIRVKRGLTKQLANFISKLPLAECSMPILVEGPYGTNIPFKAYDHSVFIAGGVGMTVVYSMCMDLAQIYRAQVLRGQKTSNEKSISVVWIVPNFESVLLFREEVERLREFSEILQLKIFVTRHHVNIPCEQLIAQGTDPMENTSLPKVDQIVESALIHDGSHAHTEGCKDKEKAGDALSQQKVEMQQFLADLAEKNGSSSVSIEFSERPDLTETLKSIYALEGPTAIIACGPSTLNADVRVATVECLRRHKHVEYYEQELLW